MATSDIELSIRVAVIQVLELIDEQGLLDEGEGGEEEREKLCLLVFDEEVKVRKAVGGFVKRVWKESVEERIILNNKKGKGGRKKVTKGVQEQDEERIGLKALVALFDKWSKTLSEISGDTEDTSENGDDILNDENRQGEGEEENESIDGPSRRASRRKEVLALVGTDYNNKKGRITLAVEALWDELDALRDWEGILEMLLLDHSSGESQTQTRMQTRNGRGVVNGNGNGRGEELSPLSPTSSDQGGSAGGSGSNSVSGLEVVKDSWRLEEAEETILLEILVCSVRQTKADAVGGKKVRWTLLKASIICVLTVDL